MIFRKIRNIREYWFWLPEKRIDCDAWHFYYPFGETKKAKASPVGINKVYFVPNKYEWLNKILGGCIYCFGTWVFIVTFTLSVSQKDAFIPTFVALFLGTGLNFIWIKILEKYA